MMSNFNSKLSLGAIMLTVSLILISCESYLDIDPPTNQIVGEVVFSDQATIEAGFAHIYSQFRESAFPAGNPTGMTYLMGMYADEMEYAATNDLEAKSFYDNSLLPSNNSVQNLWNTGYSLIYAANRILEGVENSPSLTEMDKDRFIGEALFVRAYIHFNLTNLFGAIPYITTTDYRINMKVSKMETAIINESIVKDLMRSKELIGISETGISHFRPNRWVVSAFLSRVYLYQGDWQSALDEAQNVVLDSGSDLEPNLDDVFLGNSQETLWQLDTRSPGTNTNEAYHFVVLSGPPNKATLSQSLLESFEEGDKRSVSWVGAFSNESGTWYFPNKYKLYLVTETTEEYSILFRLSEQYLIVAEASAQLGQIDQALGYLNEIRGRAGLQPLEGLEQEAVMEAILKERRAELFMEQAHRFFDLKRTGLADAVLSSEKPFWEETDIHLPIPESELLINPNLLPQNEGY
ncbi:RagB/SusD family nutrient uptake outer membrane protein [Flagellimonas olearia]|uniref:RagB/SusD family nutrient uptake outer membrane protein n=1 Tax=Flagellimonas olearia TaxID=552546 RepID=A0A6I1E9A7_9FLAO|nr:RagB/SusD family nutrient uptake outer membrane protein [Allomuricauda olearia]KAB7530304.1 RagB/SusD family nutrient uptake outer membrane protein [Allomuricauda olearia]